MPTQNEQSPFLKKQRRLIFYAMALIFLLRLSGLYQPVLDIDETVFSEFASILLNGGLPYIDAVDNKPPFMYAFFSIVYFFSGGASLPLVHLVTTFLVMATAGMVYATARLFTGFRESFAALLFFIFLTHIHEPKYISTSGETLINVMLMVSIYCYLSGKIKGFSPLRAVTGGLFLGAAVLTSYKAGIVAIVMATEVFIPASWYSTEGEKTSPPKKYVNLMTTGAASLVPVLLLIFIFHRWGVLEDFLSWGFLYNFQYIGSGSEAFSLLRPLARTLIFFAMAAPLLIIIAAGAVRMRRGEILTLPPGGYLAFLSLWFLLSLAAVLQGGRCYSHYYIQLAPPLALLAAPFFLEVTGRSTMKRRITVIFMAGLLVIFFAARIDINATCRLVNYPNRQAEPALAEAGRYIKMHAPPGETVYAWGWATPLYYHADRRSASRFLISDFFTGRVFGTANDSRDKNIALNREKNFILFLQDIKKKNPLYFVDTSPAGFFGYDRFPPRDRPALKKILEENYRRETSIKKMVLYRRVSP